MYKWMFYGSLVVLIVTNLFSLNAAVSESIGYSYLTFSYNDQKRYNDYLTALLPELAAGKSKEEIISIAQNHAPGDDPFEKDSCTWVGEAGFRFDEDGKLIGVTAKNGAFVSTELGQPCPENW
jgi:hypothetical protein